MMGYTIGQMPDACPTCDLLREKALAAMTRHIKLSGNVDIARIVYGEARAAELEPLANDARVERERAIAEYTKHRNAHSEAAEA